MQANLPIAVTVLPAVIAMILAWDALRLRRRPAGLAIAALLGTAAIWTGAYAGELSSSSLAAKLLWAKLQYLGIALIPVAWVVFADGYTGNRWRLESRWPLLLPVPMVTLALAWTNEAHGLIWASVGIEEFGGVTVLGLEHGPWFFVHVAFCYLLLAVGSARIVIGLRRKPVFNRQAWALVLGALAPWVGNLAYLTGLNPLAPLDLTPFAFVASAVALTFAVDRLGLFDLTPIAHASILASMRDGVLVLDSRDRIVEANPAALRMFTDGVDPTGHDVRDFVSAIPTGAGNQDREVRLDFTTTTGNRIAYYSLSSSPFAESAAADGGRILVITDVTDQRIAEERIHLLANQDTLTGLPNREVFRSRFERALRAASRNGANAACLFVDLDNFKRINDHYGHSVGDEVLREAVARIEKGLRANDTVMTVDGDEPTLARFGGDEFVILLEGLEQPEDAVPPAERIVRELQAPYRQGESLLSLNASVGVAVYPGDGADAETLLRNADAAMYAAKGAGGNRVQFFTERIREAVAHRITVESELHRAIEDDSFVLMYQPQVSIRTGRVVGLEALLRWDHPERGLIRPCDFVAVAEESGLIVPLSEWTLRRACSDWAALTAETGAECRVSINLSPRQFAEARLIGDMRTVLAETNMDASWLEIELTEGALMVDADATQLLLERLKELGVSLAIDDFGAGYSSLAYLRSFPLDLIKIDQSFTAGMLDDERCANLVRAMIAMAHNLGLEVVCEGVEKPDQLDLLRVAGCDRVQGYLLGRPMSIEAAIELMRDQPARRLAATA